MSIWVIEDSDGVHRTTVGDTSYSVKWKTWMYDTEVQAQRMLAVLERRNARRDGRKKPLGLHIVRYDRAAII